MDSALIVIIITLVISSLDVIVNLHSSIKSRHFESGCGMFNFLYSSEHQDNETKK